MTVTEIIEISKTRSRIYIDQEFAFVLYKGELRIYGIEKGKPVNEPAYRQITEEVLPKRAKLRCMNLLKSREYTRGQLQDKLKLGGYPDRAIEEALAYVASYRYIDDERYAADYITCNSERKSRRRIENDLQRKGISAEQVLRAYQRWEEDGNSQDETEQIRKLLEKRRFDPDNTSQEELRKLYGFLMRKGFASENIHKALKNRDADYFYLT